MAPLYIILLAVTHLAGLVFASPNTPTLGSGETQYLLSDTCGNFAKIDGKDGMMTGGEVWDNNQVFNEIDVLASGQPKPTTLKLATTVIEVSGPITARATLNVRDAEPVSLGAGGLVGVGLEGESTTDTNSLISAAKSNASVAAAQSISQLSTNFQSSMQALAISASSAVSQANESAASMVSTANAQAQSALAEASSVSISAVSAVAQAVASANSQIGLATDAASLASLQAAARISSADDRAQKQISLSQTQTKATTKIAIAVVASIIATALVSTLGFCLISHRRGRKYRRENDKRRNSHLASCARHSEQRNSYDSYYSHSEKQRQPEGRLAVQIRQPKFQEEFSINEQREEIGSYGTKLPAQIVHEACDNEDFNDKEVIVTTGELVSIERAGRPIEQNLDKVSRNPRNKTDDSNGTEVFHGNVLEPKYPTPYSIDGNKLGSRLTPTFVSRNNKKRGSILPKGWFGDRNNAAPATSTDDIGVAS